MRLALFLFLLLGALSAWSYPQYFDRGIQNCGSCHSNTLGGGLSHFLQSPSGLQPIFKYRTLYLERNPNGYNNQSRWIHMQLDLGAEGFLDSEKKILAHYIFGHQPKTQNEGSNEFSMLSRSYWIRYQVSDMDYFYVGLLAKVFGIRQVDHSSFSRKYTGFAATPTQGVGIAPGFIWHRSHDSIDWSLNFFAKNTEEPETVANSGASAQLELTAFDVLRVGASALENQNQLRQKKIQALHLRCCLDSPYKLLLEAGNNFDTTKESGAKDSASYFISQLWFLNDSPIHPFASYEKYNPKSTGEFSKYATGLQLNLHEKLEAQVEAQMITAPQDSSLPATWWILANFYFKH